MKKAIALERAIARVSTEIEGDKVTWNFPKRTLLQTLRF